MPEDIKIIFYFSLYFFILGAPLYLLYESRAIIRAVRMKNIAKRFNLRYKRSDKVPLFELTHSGKGKRNLISGKINGEDVEIYDYIIWDITLTDLHYAHHTVFINGTTIKDAEGFFWGFFRVSIKKIVNFLQELESKK
jgi:hypothetical protein